MRRYPCLKPRASSIMVALLLLAAAATAAAGSQVIGLPNCTTSCGGVSVPYPFGIDPGCSLGHSPSLFHLICNTSYTPPALLLEAGWFVGDSLQVTDISLDDATVRLRVLPSEYRFVVAPLGLRFLEEQLREWELGSTAMHGAPNGTRPGNATCPQDLGTTACHSRHSTCRANTGSYPNGVNITGYVCKCDDGYQGNPYVTDGCQGLSIGLGVGSGTIILFLILSTSFMIHRIMTQKKRMRQRFFKQNHGQLLQQLVYQRADISERMILTLEELEKATNNFDKARELGGGGHGTVYKGILSNLHVVAIKKSKIVIQREIDDFINEVVILSQINHRNVVKLHGCCLETEVPLLVYEFISNGTLYNHLYVESVVSLPWKDRVRIAVETARALAYLHSLVSMPIIHRDIKSPNILLDDNLTVKLSDFGASRYVPVDQTGLDTTVQGTFGYLDPMYHSTGHLTEKSDVYSFGVVLIELLTRKKPVSYRSPEDHGLVNHFCALLSEYNLVHILDPQVLKEACGEVIDIALLAAMCVKPISKDRPTMRQVEMTLESIHAAKDYSGLRPLFPAILARVAKAGHGLHEKLAAEICAAVAEAGGEVTAAALERMELTSSVVREALRLGPPVKFQYGRAKSDLRKISFLVCKEVCQYYPGSPESRH
ncbi:Wall-associated receptor kinase 3 [Dichanthelium oligosanthes]|uniref:Wall-associated receptor kinase 3 n=1 Tax=Dichanthelium oligosanthes TaxID=888268 RepID=A0A1E5VR35_9POAL|nr:Wall-associated receptor kinase 3 [Dichanthelium oligosanthes]